MVRANGFSTERLICAPLGESDIDDLVALNADPAVMRHINGGKPTDRREAEERVATASEYTWTARLHDNTFVGWFSLRPVEDDGPELGYRLGSAWWGRGLATEGARCLVGRALDAGDHDRIWAQTMTVNAPSRRVMEKLGMVFVRTFFGDWGEVIPGSELGDVEYELTLARWLTLRDG